jgi:hypothetical protein
MTSRPLTIPVNVNEALWGIIVAFIGLWIGLLLTLVRRRVISPEVVGEIFDTAADGASATVEAVPISSEFAVGIIMAVRTPLERLLEQGRRSRPD